MNTKIWALAAILIAGSGVGYILFGDLGDNLVYYWTPSELHDAGANAAGATIRLGGLVEPGSVRRDGDATVFHVTDGTTVTTVRTNEIPPAMFREGIGVVVEGTMGADGTFASKRLLVKHDNQYQAPKTGEKVDIEAMTGTLAGAEPTP